MALVIVRAPLRHARQHRQDRLCTVERLDLALLVDAEHQRTIRRREIEAYDVADLVHEVRIARQLEPGFPRWLLPIADNGNTMGIRPRNRP